MRIALTHGAGRLENLAAELEARGHTVLRAPLIETRPRVDDATRDAARALLERPWLLFTSRSAVEAWRALDLPLRGPKLGAVGEATGAALERAGGRVRVLGEPATAEGLARSFLARRDARGPVGLPQGDRSRPALAAALRRAGMRVVPVVVYETIVLPWAAEAAVDAVVLASPSAAEGLPGAVAARAGLVALGDTTGAALRARGLRPRIATRPDGAAVLRALEASGPSVTEREGVDPGHDAARGRKEVERKR